MSDIKFYSIMGTDKVVISFNLENATITEGEKSLRELKANTTDAATEKHVPVVNRQGNKLEVVVGSVEHPMDEDHWITSIICVQGQRVQCAELKPGQKPVAEFMVEDGPCEVYEYCNKHGLWKAQA